MVHFGEMMFWKAQTHQYSLHSFVPRIFWSVFSVHAFGLELCSIYIDNSVLLSEWLHFNTFLKISLIFVLKLVSVVMQIALVLYDRTNSQSVISMFSEYSFGNYIFLFGPFWYNDVLKNPKSSVYFISLRP